MIFFEDHLGMMTMRKNCKRSFPRQALAALDRDKRFAKSSLGVLLNLRVKYLGVLLSKFIEKYPALCSKRRCSCYIRPEIYPRPPVRNPAKNHKSICDQLSNWGRVRDGKKTVGGETAERQNQ